MTAVLDQVLLPVIVVFLVLCSDVWVFEDARLRYEHGRPVEFSIGLFTLESPADWFFCCLCFWVIFFPVYLSRRGRTD